MEGKPWDNERIPTLMSEEPTQTARASLRERHSALTRRSILDAARRLFARDGFQATSVRELAGEAGVAVQTVYTAFGSKRGVAVALNALLDEESEVMPLAERIVASDDPQEVLKLLARMQRQIWERCADIATIGRQAAMTGEPGLWQEGQGQHRQGLARVAQKLASLNALRPGLAAKDAAVELNAIGNPDTYDAYVTVGGKSFDAMEDWLFRQFCSVLKPSLRPAEPDSPRRRRR